MSASDLLTELVARCRCSVTVEINKHRDYYQTVEQRLAEWASLECPPEYSPEVRAGMVATGQIVEVQCYPDTPIGSYTVVHYDLVEALRIAVDACRSDASR